MAKKHSGLSAPPKAVDPALDALFAGSAGPVTAAPKSRYEDLPPARSGQAENSSDEEDAEDDASISEGESSGGSGDEASPSDDDESSNEGSDKEDLSGDDEVAAAKFLEAVLTSGAASHKKDKKRKRKQRDDDDGLESRHLQKLAKDDDEPVEKRQKGEDEPEDQPGEEDDAASDDGVIMHESLAADPAASELEQASRTIFLSNVSIEAITSRTAKKTLLAHLSSVLDKTASPPQTIESIRFRSTAFSTAAVPKRAAFIKKSLMDATTKSTNAYVVYSAIPAVRAAVTKLNGTVILDRHLRVDSVAHPATVDQRRCVFVGNLGFVDDESVLNVKTDEEGKEVSEKKKRTKAPMDVEEGLWRVFGKEAGKVESVRVVRDPITRVGKGIAYVQFYDANGVEAALTLAGKKFPPMLPRTLRVSRCKALHKTARAAEAKAKKASTPGTGANASADDDGKPDRKRRKTGGSDYVPKPTAEAQTLAGRASKLLGRSGGAKAAARPPSRKAERRAAARAERRAGRRSNGNDNNNDNTNKDGGEGPPAAIRTPEEVIFEGRRASAKDGKPKDLKFKGSRPKGAGRKAAQAKKTGQEGRGAVRAAKWRAEGRSK